MHLRIMGPIQKHLRSIQKATDKEAGCENRKVDFYRPGPQVVKEEPQGWCNVRPSGAIH
jgi:hypothetical protein